MDPARHIDRLIDSLDDWRGITLAAVRQAILSTEPGIVEDWKYKGSPVWSKGRAIAVGNAHRDKVKLTFAHGANLPDPYGLFNNGLNGKVWRAIDWHQGDVVDAMALQALVRAAITHNLRLRHRP